GEARVSCRRRRRLELGRALAVCLGVALLIVSAAAQAQDPSKPTSAPPPKAFPRQPGGVLGPAPKIDRAQPLYLQADQLIYDSKSSRVIAQGNVEIYYNNYILTAERVIYDQSVNKLIAEGNAQLKDPNGSITRADRFEVRDDTRIAADRASRREGNVTEYERGKFTPCKNDPGVPPLWCISAARIIHDQRAATITYQ